MNRPATTASPDTLGPLQTRFVEALESGRYRFERGCLRSERGHCTLGVAEDVRNPHLWVRHPAAARRWSEDPPRYEYACGTLANGIPNVMRLRASTVKAYRALDRHMSVRLDEVHDPRLRAELSAYCRETSEYDIYPTVAQLNDEGYDFAALAGIMRRFPRAFFRSPA